MKALSTFVNEKLKLSDYNPDQRFRYKPKNRKELDKLLSGLIAVRGWEGNFNDIDVTLVKDLSYLFEDTPFNGDISSWNVGKVKNMRGMFFDAQLFNCNISKWNTISVENMSCMFFNAFSFDQDISNWNTYNITKPENHEDMFRYCKIKEEYKPKFNN